MLRRYQTFTFPWITHWLYFIEHFLIKTPQFFPFCRSSPLLICLLFYLTSNILLWVLFHSFLLFYPALFLPLVITSPPHPTIRWNPPIPTKCTSAISLFLSSSPLLPPFFSPSSHLQQAGAPLLLLFLLDRSSALFPSLSHSPSYSLSLHPLVSPPHPFYLFLPVLHSSSAARSSQTQLSSSNNWRFRSTPDKDLAIEVGVYG